MHGLFLWILAYHQLYIASFAIRKFDGLRNRLRFGAIYSSLPVIMTYLLWVVKDIGQVAFAAVLTVVHGSHEDTSTAL